MTSINDFLFDHQIAQEMYPQMQQNNSMGYGMPMSQNGYCDYSSSSYSEDDIIDLKYIIKNKPAVNIVRDFMRENLKNIKSTEQELFEPTK